MNNSSNETMFERTESSQVFLVECQRISRGVILLKQTWELHILSEHKEVEQHLGLIQDIIKGCDDKCQILRKARNPNKLCIVRSVPHFLPYNRYLLIALKIYSEKMAFVTSVYPVDSLPSEGYQPL